MTRAPRKPKAVASRKIAATVSPQPKDEEWINHPPHYGGGANPYETIKVIEAWNLGYRLGNAVKYIARAERKGSRVEDLRKARWYLNREIEKTEL